MSSETCAALIVAGGRGLRLGADLPKQYLTLGGRAILRRTVAAFCAHPGVDMVQVVIGEGHRPLYDAALAGFTHPKLRPPVQGGAERQDSVRAGLEALADHAGLGRVLIHDAARPLAPADMIGRVIAALGHAPGVLRALGVADSLRRGEGGAATEPVARDGLFRAQTPQGFGFAAILAAHRAAAGLVLADDVEVARRAGLRIALVEGAREADKITTRADLEFAERMLTQMMKTRLGNGFDVHAFGPGEHVWLCGVQIPHDRGLVGHSDADVGLHAITDAILGALAQGDIGRHFPPSDMQWKGAASDIFLRRAVEIAREMGGEIVNIDLTLMCERPKITPHAPAMRARVAEICGIPLEDVSIKATTTERLGFTGREEGIAALATAAIEVPR